MEIVENKYAILNKEQYLLQSLTESKEIPAENTESHRKATPTKFILPLEEDETTCENDTQKQVCYDCFFFFLIPICNGFYVARMEPNVITQRILILCNELTRQKRELKL